MNFWILIGSILACFYVVRFLDKKNEMAEAAYIIALTVGSFIAVAIIWLTGSQPSSSNMTAQDARLDKVDSDHYDNEHYRR